MKLKIKLHKLLVTVAFGTRHHKSSGLLAP